MKILACTYAEVGASEIHLLDFMFVKSGGLHEFRLGLVVDQLGV